MTKANETMNMMELNEEQLEESAGGVGTATRPASEVEAEIARRKIHKWVRTDKPKEDPFPYGVYGSSTGEKQ